MNIRDIALRIAAEHFGKPYVYGAKGPDSFDCSGFLVNILQRTGQVPLDTETMWNAQKIFNEFDSLEVGQFKERPDRGDFVFYGPDIETIKHCAMCITPELIIGANGKGPKGVGRLNSVCVQPINYHQYSIQGVLDVYGE